MADPHDDMVHGLTDRVRSLLRAFDRQDRLETARAFVGWLERQQRGGKLPDAAREMLLRALHVGSDPINYCILSTLDPLQATDVASLMAATDLSRVAVSERIGDLVAVGLASRELVDDQVRGTALALGLRAMVESLAERAGERLATELASG